MRTYLRHYEITLGDIWQAYEAWLSGESGHKNAHRVIEEYGSADAMVGEIHEELRGRCLSFRPIQRYSRREPTNGKVRVIGVESVKQQVVDYLIVTLLQPLYDARIGFYQVASVKGKGQRLCRGALRRWVREGGYHVKMDVRKCYPSCRHDVVRSMYRRYVGSEDVLYAIEAVLATYGHGLEIGSFFSLKTISLVLSFCYHHVESLGKVRRGTWKPLVTHQIWHMDDVLLISRDKRDIRMAARSLERYVTRFGLELKPWKVRKTSDSEPLDLGGWVVRVGRVTLRDGTFLRGVRAFGRFSRRPSVTLAMRCASYWGWFVHGDTSRAMERRGMGATFAHARALISRDTRRLSWQSTS